MSIFSDVIGSVSPILGAALGGPVGGIIGAAIAAALGVDPNDNVAVINAVKDPAVLERLKSLEIEAQRIQTNFELGIKKTDFENLQNSRTFIQQFKFPMYIFTVIIFLYYCVYFYLLIMMSHGYLDKAIFDSIDYNIDSITQSIVTLLTGGVAVAGVNHFANKKISRNDKPNY